MNYDDILKLKDKDPIDSISGKVVGIYEKTPTAGQKNAGIIPQDVVIQDNNGDKIRLRINTEGMHLPKGAQGRTFNFEPSPNERGKPSGLTKNVFNDNHTVNVNRDAIITGDKAAPHEKTKNAKGYRPAEQPLSSPGRVDIDDHVAALCSMVRKVDADLGESDLANSDDYSDFLVRLATTVYIQSCKDNLIPKKEVVNPAVLTPIVLGSAPPAASDKPKADSFPSISEIVDAAFAGTLTADEIKRFDSIAQYNWEEIYDEVEERLVKRGHERDAVTAAFDDAKAHFVKRTKSFSSSEFCKVVLSGVPSFIEAVETAHERSLAPEPGKKTTDDIPF